jgi:hypothetical protein
MLHNNIQSTEYRLLQPSQQEGHMIGLDSAFAALSFFPSLTQLSRQIQLTMPPLDRCRQLLLNMLRLDKELLWINVISKNLGQPQDGKHPEILL